MERLSVVGIDLAGVPHRPTGFCLLRGLQAETSLLFSDQQILEAVARSEPLIVAVDAPLSLPPGRTSIHDRNAQHFRCCDLELRRKKIPFFPITLGPMRKLTERGMKLKKELERNTFEVVEIYPGGAQDIWRIPRAKHDLSGLKKGLQAWGVGGLKEKSTGDELDAVTAALVGRLYVQNQAEVYGDVSSGAIIMPKFGSFHT